MDDFHMYTHTDAGNKRAGNERSIREKIKNEATHEKRNKINEKLQANQTYREKEKTKNSQMGSEVRASERVI